MEIYLDNSATTKPYPQVITAMVSAMNHGYFNPSALYKPGFLVEKELNKVRENILKALYMKKGEVIFTSGGTEANNLGILGHLQTIREKGMVLYSAVEHAAVRESCKAAEKMGFSLKEIPVNDKGIIDLDFLENLLKKEEVSLICIMQVNNEVGSIQPVKEIGRLRNLLAPKAKIHVDGVQGFLREEMLMDLWEVDSYVLSGHKIHGTKGVGALVIKPGYRINPLLFGGGQEKNLRSGTEDTFGIIGLGKAIETMAYEDMKEMKRRKNLFWEKVQIAIPKAQRLGPQKGELEDSSHIINVAFPPVKGETLLHALEGKGIYVSTGSACSSRKQKIARTLEAMGTEQHIGESALRISLSPHTTLEEIDLAVEEIAKQYTLLAPFQKR